MIEQVGLGLIISLQNAFSQNASRIADSALRLDTGLSEAAIGIQRSTDMIQKGAMVMGAGMGLLAVPAGVVMATVATQKALGELSSVGVRDLRTIENAAEDFTNRWSGYAKSEFIGAAYDIKSALSNLSDEAVGTAASTAALTAKATKATIGEMTLAFGSGYGILRALDRDMSDAQWFEAFSGAMSKTVQQFRTTGSEMAHGMKNLGDIASASMVPMHEQLAILGQLQTTMPGEMAGTLYKSFLMKAAEGGRALGFDFLNANGQLRGMVDLVSAVKGRFPDLSQAAAQVQIKEAFGSDEAVKFLLSMSAGVDQLRAGIASVGDAKLGGLQVTQQMAEAMNRDIGARLNLMRRNFSNTMDAAGRAVLPVVIPIIDGITRVINGIQRLVNQHQGVAKAVLGAMVVVGGSLVVVGAAMMAFGALGLAVAFVQAGFIGVGIAAVASAVAAAAAWWPVWLVAAAIGAAVLAMRAMWTRNFGGMRDTAMELWRGATGGIAALLSGIATRVRAFVSGVWVPLRAALAGVFDGLSGAVAPIVTAFGRVWMAAGRILEAFGSLAGSGGVGVFETLGSAVGTLASWMVSIGGALARVFLAPLAGAATLVGWMATGISYLAQAGVWLGRVLLSVLLAPIRRLVGDVLALGRTLRDVFLMPFRAIGAALGGLWAGLWAGLEPIMSVWRESLLPAINGVNNAVSGLFGAGGGGLSFARVFESARPVIQWILSAVGLMARALGATLGGVISYVVVPALNVIVTVLGWVVSAVQAVTDAVRGAWNLISSLPGISWLIEKPATAPTQQPEHQPGLVPQRPAAPQVEIISPEVRPRMVMPAMRPMMAAGLAAMAVVPQMPAPLPTGLMPPPAVIQIESPEPAQRPFSPVFQPVRTMVSAPARNDSDIAAVLSQLRKVLAGGLRVEDSRPIEVHSNITLDGRRVGQAVARHNRDESVKEMG